MCRQHVLWLTISLTVAQVTLHVVTSVDDSGLPNHFGPKDFMVVCLRTLLRCGVDPAESCISNQPSDFNDGRYIPQTTLSVDPLIPKTPDVVSP